MTGCKRIALLVATGLALASLHVTAAAENDTVGLPRFPSINPDGSQLAFSWGGDLWRVSARGGDARRLTRHELDDLHSSWSPDGRWLTFTSMRDGTLNLWRIHRDGTQITQLTHSDRPIRNPAYTSDEDGAPVIAFSGLLEADVYRDERPYAISPEGGEHTRLHEAFGSQPQLSPGGRYTAFTRGGHYHGWNRRHYLGPDAMNVWLHDREDGTFEQITTRDGDDGSAQWVDDRTLVFMSDRELETVNLYRFDLDDEKREFERLTEFDGRDIQHFDVSRDGSTAVLQVWDTLYTLDLQDVDAEPKAVTLRAGEDGNNDYALKQIGRKVTEAALSPDGKTMAYIAYGRVYVRHMDDHSATRAVTPGTHARHQHLAWSPDGLRLYFTNDADGTESIYQAGVALTRQEIRRADVQPPAPEHPEALESPAEPPGDRPDMTPETDEASDPDDLTSGPQTVHPHDPFAPMDPGIPPEPIDPTDPTDPATPSEPIEELPDVPESIAEEHLEPENADVLPRHLDPSRWHDGLQFSVRPLVQRAYNDRNASPSPDGRSIAFRRGRGDLVVMDLRARTKETLVAGWDSSIQWRWSPDGRYIAYAQNDLNFSANIFIVPADGSQEPVNVTRHPRNDLNPRWSVDGRKLTFISNRSGASYDLYRVYLDRTLEDYTPRELSTYYRDARAAASKRRPLPTRTPAAAPGETPPDQRAAAADLDLDGAWRRIKRVTGSPVHQSANEMTPGGDRYVFNNGGEGLVAVNWDGSKRKRLGPSANVQHLSLSGDRVVYIAHGRVGVASLADGTRQHPDISDRLRIDLLQQSLQKFREAARVIGESFYRPDMKGLDWPAVVGDYESLIRRARTPSEFSDIANRMMGELAASHMGVSNPGPASVLWEPTGRLGIDQERVTLGNGKVGYRVTAVVPDGPADRGSAALHPGDIVTQIDLQPFHERDTLLRRLRGRVGQEVIVTYERPLRGRSVQQRALMTPVDFGELSRLKYDAFREESRQTVRNLSEGRVGYIHIQSMNQTSLEAFQGDLYAAAYGKDGLIIDVRNNGGGHTTDRILTSIMAANHAYTVPAGADPSANGHYPQDRLDAPRYTLPINMLANEKSHSNAEILAHAFSTLDRGTLVGQQTYGGVISTGSHRLIDGANVRRPFRGWYLPDGTDMEHNGAIPDLLVKQTPEDEVAGDDRQLKRAVEDMLGRLDGTSL
ncbi:S41 family peptidase [Aquisalimonas sp.]|uniref:S41 family peptidase n=1 Tax=Aquisalimonas sp. TaxID=1872621 RepID=UPI0025BE1337|nr:S41 family peptidase [Aquisalimonas sp.]